MSEKNRDNKNRWRNVTIAFRMSPEENEELFTPIRTMLEILNAFAEERNYEKRKKEKAQK